MNDPIKPDELKKDNKILRAFKHSWNVLKLTINDFGNAGISKMSAALAYYTIFALAPILIIVIRFSSLFAQGKPENTVYEALRSFVGDGPAQQIQDMIQNALHSSSSGVAYLVSIVALIFSATGVFTEIQDSINKIWRLKAKPKKGFLKLIINRLLSFSIVVSLGFILLVSLIASAILDSLSEKIAHFLPESKIYTATMINIGVTFATICLLFTIIFKVLPDARIRWRDVLTGSITTALLFMVGKFAISFYLSKSKISSTYGAAGSIIIILSWVYYSAIILYFGAALTRANVQLRGRRIAPNDYAVWVEQVEEKDPSISSENIAES